MVNKKINFAGVPVVRSLMITPQFFSEYLQITYYHSLIEPQIADLYKKYSKKRAIC
jgi:hypothetical protein